MSEQPPTHARWPWWASPIWVLFTILFGIFNLLKVDRLRTRPGLVQTITLLLFLLWTGASVTTCESTKVHSPATVFVRGYTRRDGLTVNSYYRRPSGVASRDERENADTEWIRWLISAGWLVGCGVVALFYGAASGTFTKEDPPT